jgi:DNA-directed RNA polymerase subunit beta'
MGHIDLASPVAHIWYTRRVPSYLGQLLDISRRNLDRVLYFAQYIVTYVDDDARQKALKRLEEEITVSEREVADQINTQILEIKKERDRRIAEMKKQETDLQARADEQIAARIEPVMQEGQSIERSLQEMSGKISPSRIVFNAANAIIAEKGEEITAKNISNVQRIVKEKLDELETEFRANLKRELEAMELSKAQLKAEADEQMEALRNRLDDESVETQNQNTVPAEK